jgi:hypothetical protein
MVEKEASQIFHAHGLEISRIRGLYLDNVRSFCENLHRLYDIGKYALGFMIFGIVMSPQHKLVVTWELLFWHKLTQEAFIK